MEIREGEEDKSGSTILIRSSRMSINMSGFVATLELRYLSKGRSEFGANNSIRKIKCDVIQGICKLKVELLNWVGG